MTTWTHLGEHLPWLRGQGIHVAEERSSVTLADTLVRAGFTVAVAEPGYPGIAAALKLPAKADSNLDALAEALQNLPARWPGAARLVLLVPAADWLLRQDLLVWTELGLVLRQATMDLWDRHAVVFETVFLVPNGEFGGDGPY